MIRLQDFAKLEKSFEEILNLIPPCELHLMLGTCNKIVDALNKKLGDDKLSEWIHSNAIVRYNYFGGSLEGNKCKSLLRMRMQGAWRKKN